MRFTVGDSGVCSCDAFPVLINSFCLLVSDKLNFVLYLPTYLFVVNSFFIFLFLCVCAVVVDCNVLMI